LRFGAQEPSDSAIKRLYINGLLEPGGIVRQRNFAGLAADRQPNLTGSLALFLEHTDLK
jgi:hypothetical protein